LWEPLVPVLKINSKNWSGFPAKFERIDQGIKFLFSKCWFS
jgi:hypothetical protein